MDRQQCAIDSINGRSNEIDGWFYPLDMMLIVILDILQKAFNVLGDLCEVGVYDGESLVLFGMLARDNETLLAMDAYPDDYLESARRAVTQFCPWPLSVKFIEGDTALYTATTLRDLFPSKARFLHIDAGHEYHEVLHSLYLLAPHVHPDGIIIMDDYQDREFPGVAAAVLDFCENSQPRQFIPFVSGGNKMYLCSPGIAHRYQTSLICQEAFRDKMRLSRIRDSLVLVAASREPMRSDAILKLMEQDVVEYATEADIQELSRVAKRNAQQTIKAAAARAALGGICGSNEGPHPA